MGFIRRLGKFCRSLLIAIDQLLHVVLAGPHFLFFGGAAPHPDETISSRVGRGALKGRPWALVCERLINSLFWLFGEKDHCRRSVEWDLRKRMSSFYD